MSRIVLDPSGERPPTQRPRAPRLETLEGRTIGLLDIAKPRGDILLQRIAEGLERRGAVTRHYRKPTFTKPAPVDLRHRIAVECDAVVEALAD